MYRRIALFAPLLASLAASGACSDDAVREYEGFCTATSDYQTDGTPDEITTNTYNPAGLQTRSERDTNADGVADQIRSFSYDGAGLLVSEEEDDDADGQPETAFAYTHDAEGNLVRVERMDNGVVTSVSTYTYHPNRTTASERADQDGDGQWDLELQFDQHGNLLQLGYDQDGDGVADHGQIWDRDAEGKILTHTTYQDVPFGDPAPNGIDTYAYDAAGYLVEIESYGYIPSEGIRGRTTVEWSLDHTDMVETRDDGDDGTVDSTVHKV